MCCGIREIKLCDTQLVKNNERFGGKSSSALHQAATHLHVTDYFPITGPPVVFYSLYDNFHSSHESMKWCKTNPIVCSLKSLLKCGCKDHYWLDLNASWVIPECCKCLPKTKSTPVLIREQMATRAVIKLQMGLTCRSINGNATLPASGLLTKNDLLFILKSI